MKEGLRSLGRRACQVIGEALVKGGSSHRGKFGISGMGMEMLWWQRVEESNRELHDPVSAKIESGKGE